MALAKLRLTHINMRHNHLSRTPGSYEVTQRAEQKSILLTHHESAHHLVVLVHAIVAVHHVLAQMRAVASCYDGLANICANVHDLRQVASALRAAVLNVYNNAASQLA
jgi:hypothetical protein